MDDTRENTRAAVRLVEANRAQARLVSVDLEALLPPDHQARAIWALVERVDLSPFYARVAAREGTAGRPATDPQILLALWILATVDGIGSARAIERQCAQNLPYQWICGGRPVGYHTLSDFRSESSDQLQEVLAQLVAMLMSQDLVQLQRVAQDGMRVRASAGASSFRKRPTLEKLQRVARRQVETLTRQIDDETALGTKRETAARLRAEEDREKRIARALEEMNEVERRKKSNNGKKKSEPRASTTDPSARVMKMGDGGFRPAYNVHLATDAETRVIVAVDVDNRGTDTHKMVPLAKQIEQSSGKRPSEWLADGGCASLDNIEAMDARGCKVYSPLRNRRSGVDRSVILPTDSEAIKAWRERMNSDAGKATYKQRGAAAEWVNARCRAQGLGQFLVRGLEKVRAVALLHAITNNFMRALAFNT